MFSKAGTYEAVGLFTRTHIISIFLCYAVIIVAVIFSKKMAVNHYLILLKVFSILLTFLELFKISWSLKNGYTYLDAFVPLYFCSLFIYALWLTWFKNKTLRNAGLSYIMLASIVAGSVFIFMPTSSFNTYPIFHFQCMYSMLFHSIMVYSGIMAYKCKAADVNLKLVLKYCNFCLVFMSLAIILNINYGSNLMFLANPGKIPLEFLNDIFATSSIVYTLVLVLAHLLLGLASCGIYKLFRKKS